MMEDDDWFDDLDDDLIDYPEVQRYEMMLIESKPVYFELDEFERITHYYLVRGCTIEAQQVVQYAEYCYPDSSEVKLLLAKVLLGSFKLDQVLQVLKDLEAMAPDWASVNLLRGKTYLLQNSPDKAQTEFDTAIRKEPSDLLEMSFSISDFFLESNEVDYAAKFLEQVRLKLPPDAELYSQLAHCYERLAKNDKAEVLYEKALDETPFNKIIWMTLGLLRERTDRPEQALDAFNFALTIDEGFEQCLMAKASTLMSMKRYDDAIQTLSESIVDLPNNSYALRMIAECYENMNRLEESLAYYRKALDVDPIYAEAFFGMSSILRKQGDPEGALRTIDKALEIEPEYPDFLFARGELLLQVGAKEEAMLLFRKMVEDDPYDPEVWILMSYMIEEEKGVSEAINLMEGAYSYCSTTAEFTCRLAILYYQNKEYTPCAKHLKYSILFDKKSAEVFLASCPDALQIEEIKEAVEFKKE